MSHCSGVGTENERRTERLRLRPVALDDRDAFIAIHADPRANLQAWDAGLSYWAVEFEGNVIGFAGAEAMPVLGRHCWNLYYRLAPEAWNRGFATEAAREAVRTAAAVDGSRPLIAQTRPENIAAIRVAETCGPDSSS